MSTRQQLNDIYRRLFHRYGPQYWWPGETPFEVIVGAILTQSTAWANVEQAISNLKQAGILSLEGLRRIPDDRLAELIRPSGYFNAKARKLKAFVERVGNAHNGSLDELFASEIPDLRVELLSIHGIGPETADSIILYAAGKPVFVIDAYTQRIMDRLGLNPAPGKYQRLQSLFMDNLPLDERLFNEYHALFVRHGKDVCRKSRPDCPGCCLRDLCRFDRFRTEEAAG